MDDPERGLARVFLGRVGYNIGTRRSVAFEAAERQNGAGTWVHLEYSHLLSSHWRATLEGVGTTNRNGDFLGQCHRNTHFVLKVRYSS
jgi:hypothetical protein